VFGQGLPGGDLILESQNNGTYEYSLYATHSGGWQFPGTGATAIVISGLSGVTGATVFGLLATSGESFNPPVDNGTPNNCGLKASFTSTSVTLAVVAPPGTIACLIFGDVTFYLGNLEITSTGAVPGTANVAFTQEFNGGAYFGTSYETTTGPVAPTLTVPIIVNPGGGQPPTINTKNNGKIAVAILSTANWSAPANVIPSSLTFGKIGSEQSFAGCNAPKDVNGDGYLDLVCNFNTQQTAFQTTDTTANLKGMTTGGIPLQGSAAVRVNK
jgi:hypothetical protein